MARHGLPAQASGLTKNLLRVRVVRTVVTCRMPGPDGEVGGIVSYAYDPNAKRHSVAVVLGAHGQTFAVPLLYDKARGTLQWQIPAKLGGTSLHLRALGFGINRFPEALVGVIANWPQTVGRSDT
jgi:hypothetical protein